MILKILENYMLIASLRTMFSDIKNEHLKHEYDTNFISEIYPKCALSPNTISSFLEKIGKSSSKMEDFMNKRLEEFSNHSIVIDGMLKNNTSETNIFSGNVTESLELKALKKTLFMLMILMHKNLLQFCLPRKYANELHCF